MEELNPVASLVLHIVCFVTGMSSNIFILVVNCLDWWKTVDINTYDLIINCTGFCNTSLIGTLLVNELFRVMFNRFYSQDWVIKSILAMLISISFSSLWFSTCLCFYYCVKIINLNADWFYKLRTKVSTIVPWLVLASVIVSWIAGLASYWDLTVEVNTPIVANSSGIKGLLSRFIFTSRCSCLFQIYMAKSALAFTIIVSTAVAIITSLYKHVRKMKKNKEGFGKASLDTHMAAAQTVTSLLTLYMVFYGVQNVMYNMPTLVSSMLFSLCIIATALFPTLNALILICGNTKLKNILKRLFKVKSGGSHSESHGITGAASTS